MEKLLENFPWLEMQWMDTPLWAWILLPMIFLVAWSISRIVVSLLVQLITMLRKGDFELLKKTPPPLSLLLAGVILNASQSMLPIMERATTTTDAFNTLIYAFSITWLAMIAANLFFQNMSRRLCNTNHAAAIAVIPLMRKLSKAVIFAMSLLFVLQNWGFDVAAIMAALGVGGIAIALASQKTVENLFGGVMLSLDQPIRVGDFGKFGDIVGTVEDIGLRSTRIRTLGRTIVTIPNSQFAGMEIETFATRDRILFKHVLGLRYETSSDQIRHIVVQIKEMLLSHPRVENLPARPRFVGFNDYSQDVEVFAYVNTSVWDDFLEVQEDLLLRIKDIVEEGGSDFAFPSQTIYFERGSGLNAKVQKQIQKIVEGQRTEKTLQWPHITNERKRTLIDSIQFPPQGSAILETAGGGKPKKNNTTSRGGADEGE